MQRKENRNLGVLSAFTVAGKRLIKICGITRLEDAMVSIEHGANALGFNFYPKSSRYIAPEKANEIIEQLPEDVLKVAVIVHEYRDAGYRAPNTEHQTSAPRKSDSRDYNSKSEHREPSTENQEPTPNHQPPTTPSASRVTLHAIQLHGIDHPEDIPACNLPLIIATSPEDAQRFSDHDIIIDTSWGRGELADWEALKDLDRPYILSGGLAPHNIEEAIDLLNPAGIDVCSGVESEPGIKDHDKLKDFLRRIDRAR